MSEADCWPAWAGHIVALIGAPETREQKAKRLVKESGKTVHSNTCATSLAPAEEPGPCDCGAGGGMTGGIHSRHCTCVGCVPSNAKTKTNNKKAEGKKSGHPAPKIREKLQREQETPQP